MTLGRSLEEEEEGGEGAVGRGGKEEVGRGGKEEVGRGGRGEGMVFVGIIFEGKGRLVTTHASSIVRLGSFYDGYREIRY
jgi:hypothetical protein